jgi:hypothetical protein
MKMKAMRRGLIASAILGCVAVSSASQVFGASPGPGISPGSNTAVASSDPFGSYVAAAGPEIPQSQILASATTAAQRAGDQSPGVSIGSGTLEAAMRTVDSSFARPEPGRSQGYSALMNSSVDLVAMTGQFTLLDARVPIGAAAPKGNVLDLIIDAHTGALIGRALPTPEAQLAQAGIGPTAVASRVRIALHAVTGTVSGQLFLSGGPPSSGGTRPGDRFRVVATAGSHTVGSTRTGSKGRFTLRLRPGSYVVSGAGADCLKKPVRVRSGKTTNVKLACSIR